MTISESDWDQRNAALWATIDSYDPPTFRTEIAKLIAELPPGSPIGLFEAACANDSTGRSDRAVPLYQEALAGGLTGARRRRATIQLASSMRNIGRVSDGLQLLVAEQQAGSDDLDDAVTAFLALLLVDAGREREAAALALSALSRHLVRYSRSLGNYAQEILDGCAEREVVSRKG